MQTVAARLSDPVASWARLALLACAGVLLACVALEQGALLSDAGSAAARAWLVPAAMVAACAGCAARAALVSVERLPWALLAVAFALYVVGQVYWALWLEPRAEPPFPSLADGLWLALYPLAFAALVLVASGRLRGFHVGIWLDALAGGAALAALWQAIALGPVLAGAEGIGTLAGAVLLAYPFGDLLLVALVSGVFALSQRIPGPSWVLLGGGFVLFAAADMLRDAMVAQGELVPSLAVAAMWSLGMLAVALAAWMPADRTTARAYSVRGLLIVPSSTMVLAVAVLLYGNIADVDRGAVLLAAGAILVGIVRAYFTLQELALLSRSREEAVTDYLTGLGNRRKLMRELGRIVGEEAAATVLVLDLDGFKAYNDRYGHVQGDLLLARLGDRLARAVDGEGEAYRLGGDEFCVVLPGAQQLAERTAHAEAALAESGKGFEIACTSGWSLLPDEAATPSDALRVADARMYARKNARPGAAKRQAADLALGFISAQRPALERHVGTVARLAVRVGRELGLEPSELDDLARAAELHDVGKLAIPAGILEKPGPLDEEEARHIRRHTLVGERMLGAAPALAHVGRIVRSTHERFDGGGYPDGLAGEDIPLAARVIAVCDAYDAIVSARPYRSRRSSDEAAAEIERAAGTQFDPAVVRAFLEVVATFDAGDLRRAS
jgi:diguanylate cyclase (GGDEF)-like protein